MNTQGKSYASRMLLIFLCCVSLATNDLAAFERERMHSKAVAESLVPIRPGSPGQAPFWNVNATRFIHAPALDFQPVEGASSYRLIARSEADGQEYTFQADMPWVPLTPVWQEIPVGYVSLIVHALDSDGEVIGNCGERRFYRAAVFNGPYSEAVVDYCESARLGLKYLFDSSYLQRWLVDGQPDTLYGLYCYPSKMVAAVISGMLLYTEISPDDKQAALAIAAKAAQYLISISEPAGAPLEFFPPTYNYRHISPDSKYFGRLRKLSLEYHNQIMLIYCARVANAYLDLYAVSNDPALLDAARGIADTYARIQLDDGNWYLKMYRDSGKGVTENYAQSGGMIALFKRLRDILGEDIYGEQIQLAEQSQTQPFEEFNFEGQFEDVPPSELYKNLSHWPALSAANHYFSHAAQNEENLAMAEEILHFAEDQFVVWEQPCPLPRPEREDRLSEDWLVPGALEQYHYYVPIDASAASFITAYRQAFEVTGDSLYLAKAVCLANQMTVVQESGSGRYPTYWWKAMYDNPGWINCAITDARVMWEFGRFLEENDISH